MSIIATAVRHLMAAGVTGDALVEAIAEMEAAQPKDAVAEKRRAYDRERKKRMREENKSGGSPPDSADIADTPALSPSPNDYNSNPHPHTHPDNTTRARDAEPFPKPEWADPQVWRDLKANRRAKRLPCTPTAHAKLMKDINKLTDDDWPPGRLLQAIVARGWAAAYDPREDRKPSNDRHTKPTGTRNAAQGALARLSASGHH